MFYKIAQSKRQLLIQRLRRLRFFGYSDVIKIAAELKYCSAERRIREFIEENIIKKLDKDERDSFGLNRKGRKINAFFRTI